MTQALGVALSKVCESAKDVTTVPATVSFPVKAQLSSSVHTIELGKMKLEGKEMRLILVDFSEPQEDCALNSSSTTVAF